MVNRRLILIRHCQSSGQAPDAELTELGLGQALALRDFLSDMQVDVIVSSAYTRAQQSIAPFAGAMGLTVRTDPRLNERRLSETPPENWRELIRDSFDDLDLRGAGGESAREVLARAWACLEGLLSGDRQLPLAVTHGNLLSLVLSSLEPSFGYRGWENLSNPDVFMLQETGDRQLTFERLWSG